MFGGSPGLIFRRECATGKVGDWCPSPHVLWVFPKLLEAEAAIWSPKYVDTSVPFGGLKADQHPPRFVET
jgi:hypothetical protein